MAEEEGHQTSATRPSDPAAWAALGAASRKEADAFLRKQSELADLQIEDLKRENAIRHWSLRFANLSAVMKVTFEVALAFVMLAIAGLIAFAVWNAAHDDGLVIESFDVPQDMAAKGLGGQVIASQLQDRIAFIQSHADTIRAASTFRNDWGDDIKVQIPDTGVSVGEAYRFLVLWLGNETHVTGELWHDSKGIALAARAGNTPARIFRGSENDLDMLIEKAAEYVYQQTQPYRYTVFLDDQNRTAEGLAATKELALNGPVLDQAWAYSRWGTELDVLGDFKTEIEMENRAVALDPNLPHVFGNLAAVEDEVGHDEAGLHANQRSLELLKSGGWHNYAALAVPEFRATQTTLIAEQEGDFGEAVARAAEAQALPDYNQAHRSAPFEESSDLARLHDVFSSLKADSEAPNEVATEFRLMLNGDYSWDTPPLPEAMRRAAVDDWRGVRDDLEAIGKLPLASDPHIKALLPVVTWPWLAYADARLGDFQSAHPLINKTPLDCYLCVRMRGNIEAAAENRSSAELWFTEAVRQAPSIPFAYTDWGAMLLHEGRYDAAIEKFRAANLKGPHFADPLEMWGEALMQKNRSDLALAKFEEANTYAPNWGRLHLEWGKALTYVGRKDEAKKQFAIAAGLDLSRSDKSSLATWQRI